MPFIPQQAPANLELDGLRKHEEDQFREVARAWTELLTYTQQKLTSAQLAQIYENLGLTGEVAKNYVINGSMLVTQETGGAPSTVNGYYPVDQFTVSYVYGGVATASLSGVYTPGGSPNRIKVVVNTADAAVAAADYYMLFTSLEGTRVSDLRFGSAAAETVTLRFGVKAPAGTYCVTLENMAQTRSYVAEYVITASEANTDVVKSVVIPGDITGTWFIDVSTGIRIFWTLMGGTTFQAAANTWVAFTALSTTNQINFMATVGNTFELFDVGLYKGTVAPPHVVSDYPTELEACQRYYYKTDLGAPNNYGIAGIGYGGTPGAFIGSYQTFHVRMRTTPACTFFGTWQLANCPTPTFWIACPDNFSFYTTATAAGNVTFYGAGIIANARLP